MVALCSDTMDIFYLISLAVMMQGLQLSVSGAGKCTYTREFRMMGANCFGQELVEVPSNLNKDIEILYAAKNRIRSLTNSSFQHYTSLRFIYLGDNFITKIEPGAFAELSDLEVLDLSINAIRSLPTDLPPPLRKLYLAENRDLLNLSLPSAFNLQFLSLAGCDLKEFPTLGVLPNLKELNVTGNPLKEVTPAHLAPLCRLEKLFLPQTLFKEAGPHTQCQCHRLLTWTTQRYISLPGFNCTSLEDPDAAACDVDLSEEMKVYKSCLVAAPATASHFLLMVVLAGALLLAAVIIGCWWRKGRRKKNSVQDNKRPEKSLKSADTLIT